MSPSEAQLRAALHDGEGDSPDANAVISRVMRSRYERRKRLTAIAGGAAAAAVVGVGTTVLVALGGHGSEKSAADRGAGGAASFGANGGRLSDPAAQIPARGATSSTALATAKDAAGFAAALPCPAGADRLALPGGGGSGQFGSSDPLFAGQVAAMKVCAYPARVGAPVRSVIVTQREANDFAAALEAAPVQPSGTSCPGTTDFVGGTIEILAVDARGAALKPVVIIVECASSRATNGIAVRYATSIPDRFVTMLLVNTPKSISNSGAQESPPR